jgi:Domain of unknown function (DUF1929)/Glyoxal oxidase N-terminus
MIGEAIDLFGLTISPRILINRTRTAAGRGFATREQKMRGIGTPAGRQRRAVGVAVVVATMAAALAVGEGAHAEPSTKPQGEWSPVYDWPNIAVHLSLLPNGRVLSWEGGDAPNASTGKTGSTRVHVVEIPEGEAPPTTVVAVKNTRSNLFCSGHAFLPDGRLLVTGGRAAQTYGIPDLNIFDYRGSGGWQTITGLPASYARWYASALSLGTGDVLLLAGNMNGDTDPNRLPQVWRPADASFRDLTGAQRTVNNYPMIFLAPNGKVFLAGREKATLFLDPAGTGAWSAGPNRQFAVRGDGTAVMYDDGKVLTLGGGKRGATPTNTAEVIDLNVAAPAWRYTGAMQNARRHANATLLPDGKVLVTGGSSSAQNNNAAGAILAAELWDPATGAWATMASMTNPRIYHSTAILLPDGRVLTAGGSRPTGYASNLNNAQIFSPPYLFQGERPTIAAAPGTIGYGSTFTVQTPDAAGIAKVRLVRLSSVTHSFNMNQRIATLGFSQAADGPGLQVDMPSDPNLVPPGQYMLFILTGEGVPSTARIVTVG